MEVLQCRFEDGEAIGVFSLSRGCVVYPNDREQALCLHHAMRATPLGDMELVRDLTLDGSFTEFLEQRK